MLVISRLPKFRPIDISLRMFHKSWICAPSKQYFSGQYRQYNIVGVDRVQIFMSQAKTSLKNFGLSRGFICAPTKQYSSGRYRQYNIGSPRLILYAELRYLFNGFTSTFGNTLGQSTSNKPSIHLGAFQWLIVDINSLYSF